MNTFVRALLRYEGVQLHLGLRVVNIFSTFFCDIPYYKNTKNAFLCYNRSHHSRNEDFVGDILLKVSN